MNTEFKITATRTDEYTVIVDKEKLPKKFLAEYSQYFRRSAKTLNDALEDLGFILLRFGTGKHIEGFGYIRTLKKEPVSLAVKGRTHDWVEIPQWDGNILVGEKDYTPGIIIQIINEDDEIEVKVTEKTTTHV